MITQHIYYPYSLFCLAKQGFYTSTYRLCIHSRSPVYRHWTVAIYFETTWRGLGAIIGQGRPFQHQSFCQTCCHPWPFVKCKYTLQGTNISPKNGILKMKMIFLLPRWDMLIPWRVYFTRLWCHKTICCRYVSTVTGLEVTTAGIMPRLWRLRCHKVTFHTLLSRELEVSAWNLQAICNQWCLYLHIIIHICF